MNGVIKQMNGYILIFTVDKWCIYHDERIIRYFERVAK